jgi:hypothetical protein
VRELCGKAGVNSVTLCHPLLYGLHVAPLERGRRDPRKRYGRQPCTRAGSRHDVAPVGRVSSVTSGPVRPSPPLCHHPRHCSTIPGVVGTRDDKTSPHPPLCILRPSVSSTLKLAYRRRPDGKLPHDHPRSLSLVSTRLATTPDGSKNRKDDHQFVSTVHHAAICST